MTLNKRLKLHSFNIPELPVLRRGFCPFWTSCRLLPSVLWVAPRFPDTDFSDSPATDIAQTRKLFHPCTFSGRDRNNCLNVNVI